MLEADQLLLQRFKQRNYRFLIEIERPQFMSGNMTLVVILLDIEINFTIMKLWTTLTKLNKNTEM